jgi:hypothetical protein
VQAQEPGGKAGIEFTEVMEGEIQFCGRGEDTKGLVDVDDGCEKGACSEARLFVSAKGWDVDSRECDFFFVEPYSSLSVSTNDKRH